MPFPIRDALRHELSWTHYRLLSRVETEEKKYFISMKVLKETLQVFIIKWI